MGTVVNQTGSHNRMRFWTYVNILSIDISLGAVGACLFFASLFQVTLLPPAYLSLGLVVWLIYTLDHLRDAVHKGTSLSHERHRFHFTYRRFISLTVAVVAVVAAVLTLYVRAPIREAGILLGVLVVVYLAVQHRLKFIKEVSGALLYTAGVALAPISILGRSLTAPESAALLAFFLTTWTNLLICSLYDHDLDKVDGHHSIATTLGPSLTRRLILLLFGMVAMLLLYLFLTPHASKVAAVVLLLMNLVLFTVSSTSSFFSVGGRHRLFADLAFLIPLFVLLINGLPRL